MKGYIIGFSFLAASLTAMEESSQKIKIILKNQPVVTISDDQWENLKGVIDKDLKLEFEERGSEENDYSLPSITKAQFDLILSNLESITSESPEETLIALKDKDRNQLLNLMDAANYLGIDAIMSLFEKTLKEDIFKSLSENPDLVEALLIPKFITLFRIDLNRQNKHGETPLMIATKKRNTNIVELLIKAKADVNKKEKRRYETPLMWAAYKGYISIAKLLLNAGAKINEQGTLRSATALMWAITRGHSDVVETLIKHGASIDGQNDRGETPLIMAVQQEDILCEEIAELLIEANADLNKKTKKGVTALMCASEAGHRDSVESLIKHGADIDAQNDKGETALILASQQKGFDFEEIVELLIKAKANLNKQTKKGLTALICAVKNESEDIVKLLIQAKASISKKDKGGMTALMWAKAKENDHITGLLEEAANNNNIFASLKNLFVKSDISDNEPF